MGGTVTAKVGYNSQVHSSGARIRRAPFSEITLCVSLDALPLIYPGVMEEGTKKAGFESLMIFRPAAITGNANTPGFISWISPGMDKIVPKK